MLCLFCLVLFMTRRLYLHTSGIVWIVSGVQTLATVPLGPADLPSSSVLRQYWGLYLPLYFVVGLLVNYGIFSVPHHYVSKTLPAHLKNFVDLFERRFRAQPAGLAVVRGALLGSCYLAGHACLLLLLGNWKIAAAGIFWFAGAVAESGAGAQWVVSLSVLVAIAATWPLVALPVALARRITARRSILLGSAVLVWLVAAVPVHGATVYPTLFLYIFTAIQALFFALVFLRYDLLTCLFSMFTVQTWLMSYALFRIFGKAEPWPSSAGLLLWFSLALVGTAIWFRPQLAASWRRLAAVFE